MTIYALKKVKDLELEDILLLSTDAPFAHGKITFVEQDNNNIDIEYIYGIGLDNFNSENLYTCYYDNLDDQVLVLQKA